MKRRVDRISRPWRTESMHPRRRYAAANLAPGRAATAVASLAEKALYELDAPVARVCSAGARRPVRMRVPVSGLSRAVIR